MVRQRLDKLKRGVGLIFGPRKRAGTVFDLYRAIPGLSTKFRYIQSLTQ